MSAGEDALTVIAGPWCSDSECWHNLSSEYNRAHFGVMAKMYASLSLVSSTLELCGVLASAGHVPPPRTAVRCPSAAHCIAVLPHPISVPLIP
eukprot:3213355-Rhodomonas_salina.1